MSKRWRRFHELAVVLGLFSIILSPPQSIADDEIAFELSTTLMRSTFKITGSKKFGTAFIVGKQIPDTLGQAFYVLVTAAHVLRDIEEDEATLWLRKKEGDNFSRLYWKVPIRQSKKPLWIEHPEADIAVMYVKLPKVADIEFLPLSFLATDKELKDYQIHPGDGLFCLGFPLGAEANEAGFPILRSGTIASFPLFPTSKTKTFLFDFAVFGGNSGGPVYFEDTNRSNRGAIKLGEVLHIGLVSEQHVVTQKV